MLGAQEMFVMVVNTRYHTGYLQNTSLTMIPHSLFLLPATPDDSDSQG